MIKTLWIFVALFFIATASYAAGGHDDGIPVKTIIFQVINTCLLIALLYTLTRKKIVNYFTQRVEQHGKAKDSAVRAYKEAQEKHEEVKNKLHSLVQGEEGALAKAQEEAKLLKSRLIHEAEALAKTIIDDAKKTTEYEYAKAKQMLREEVFANAIETSKTSIQKNMTKEDQANLRKEFVESVGAQS